MHASLPIFLASVLGLGLAAQWLAWRLRAPAILLLLLLGFACRWYFGDPEPLLGRDLLFAIVSLSVAVILFEGGLTLRLAEVRETGRVVVLLVTLGIGITWLLTTLAAAWILDFCWPMAALAGAVLVVSGPTVVIPLLRHVRPNRRVGTIAKWEGIVNDPIGAILATVIMVAIISEGGGAWHVIHTLGAWLVFLAVGAAVGTVFALAAIQLLRRYWIPDYLQNPALLTAVIVCYLLSNWLRPESGLMAVTVFGLILANQRQVTVRHVVEFKENLRVLIISCLFIVLAARLDPDVLTDLRWPGVLFLAALILVVRPVAAVCSSIGGTLTWAERCFLAWMHPRGIVAAAVASVFALELAEAEWLPAAVRDDAQRLVPVTFLVIVGTVAVYGLTVGPLARRLRVAESDPQGILFAGAGPLVRAIADVVQREGFPVLLVDLNQANVTDARMAGLPACWANIISEFAREELDLSGIGRLLAMTPSDEVNSLAAREYIELFGRAEIYQLAHRPGRIGSLQRLTAETPGRVLFESAAHFEQLDERFHAGEVVKATSLTTEFDYNAFLRYYGSAAEVMMVVESSRRLRIVTADANLEPQPGQKLISLVSPRQETPRVPKEAPAVPPGAEVEG